MDWFIWFLAGHLRAKVWLLIAAFVISYWLGRWEGQSMCAGK